MRGGKETIGSVLCALVVLGVLISVDPRVRMKASAVLEDPMAGAVTPWGDRLSDLGGALMDAARVQSLENAPLLVFAVVGGILFLFMLKI